MTSLLRPLAAIASGVLLSFGFPRWNFETAVWIWLLPLLAVLWIGQAPVVDPAKGRIRRWWRALWAFRIGYLAGLGFFLPNLSWVRHSSRVINGAIGDEWMGLPVELMGWGAVLGLSLIVSVYFGLWAWFTAVVARPREQQSGSKSSVTASLESLRCGFLTAAAWAGLEWIRGWFLTGFGWNGLGVVFHGNPVLMQAADLIGVTGLSFLPVFAGTVGFQVVHRLVSYAREHRRMRYHFDLVVVLATILLAAWYGVRRLAEPVDTSGPSVRIALVQQNVRQIDIFGREGIPERYLRYAEMTRMHAESRDGSGKSPVDLVIWPESALGLPLDHPEHEGYFNELMSMGDFSLLAGGDMISPAGPNYTSAALFHRAYNGMQLHHKVHLVPFGEYLPLRPILGPFLGGVLPGDFDFGIKTDALPLRNLPVQVIPLICFEDTDGGLTRKFITSEPQILTNLTNDGWFLQSVEPEVHLANAVFRAVELRRPMCRATNTGVTCFIDDRGRITSQLTDPETGSHLMQGVLQGVIHLPKQQVLTLYARWGDWFAKACCVIALLALIMRRFSRKA